MRPESLHLRFMWLVSLLLVSSLSVQGDLKVTLEPAVYAESSGGAVIELSYEIPYTSLTFVRDSGRFLARYRIGIQVTDARGNVVAGDIWQPTLSQADYASTVGRDSMATGVVRLAVPANATDARVSVSDLASDRRASSTFKVSVPTGGMIIRLLKGGLIYPARKYGAGDTLAALAEVLPLRTGPRAATDSCRFTVKQGNRVLTGATAPTFDSLGRRVARFSYPVADSSQVTTLGGGEYVLEVVGLGSESGLRASVPFRVDVPFYLDDAAWQGRVDKLIWIAKHDETRRLRSLPRPEREKAWREFWASKDRTPTTGRNEREEEYFERIDYAEEHFGHADRGYKSDRGHVYVVYGPPDEIDSRPFEIDSPAYETWHYYEIGRKFIFVDRYGSGAFRLESPEVIDEP